MLEKVGSIVYNQEKKITLSLSDKHLESQWDEIVMGVVAGSSISIVFASFILEACPVFISTATTPSYNIKML